VLQAYRWQLVERHLDLDFSRKSNDSKLVDEEMAELRGQISLIQALMTGGLDLLVRELTGAPESDTSPTVTDYMPREATEEDTDAR
jgi:hypothetical protein